MTAAPGPSVHGWMAQQRVHHAADIVVALPAELRGARRVLLLTTPSLAGTAIRDAVERALGALRVVAHDTMRAHTPAEDAAAAAVLIRDHAVDTVVALGGGSVIDGAKTACFAAWRGLHDAGALLAGLPRGLDPSGWDGAPPSPRIVAVPTTLSAAEFSAHAGVTDLAIGRKHVFVHPMMVPRAVILDPRATLHTPAELLLSSGIRAVDHAVERWCSVRPQPFSDAVSMQAMTMLAPGLRALHRDPADLGARSACQYGAWLSIMGGWAGVPVGASHGLGYILGAGFGVAHGITSCVTLPAVMRWNEPVNAARQEDIARVFRGDSAHAGLRGFIRALGLPTTLREVGIEGEANLADIAARHDGTGPIATNPRPVPGAAELLEIVRLAA